MQTRGTRPHNVLWRIRGVGSLIGAAHPASWVRTGLAPPGSRHEGACHGCSHLGRPVRPPETPHQRSERSPGFLAGYSGRTREAYTLDLRMFYRWCEEHQLALFEITRTNIELYRANSRSMVEPPPP